MYQALVVKLEITKLYESLVPDSSSGKSTNFQDRERIGQASATTGLLIRPQGERYLLGPPFCVTNDH
jgi:adenosylmethionine-8-amino-7-oxononanoate aminotransferase